MESRSEAVTLEMDVPNISSGKTTHILSPSVHEDSALLDSFYWIIQPIKVNISYESDNSSY